MYQKSGKSFQSRMWSPAVDILKKDGIIKKRRTLEGKFNKER